MPGFRYRAVDPSGTAQRGLIEAPSAEAARKLLRGRALLPLAVSPARTAQTTQGRLPPKTLALITRQLATLVGGGVRIDAALKTVAEEAAPKPAALLTMLHDAVLDGRSFADALDSYPKVFSEAYRASIRAGETAGQLPVVMDHLAEFVETRARNARTVQLALLYPALLALVSLGVIVALLTFVVPDIVRVFTNRGADLPALTQALIAASNWVQSYGLIALGAFGAALLAALAILQRPAARLVWDGWLLRTPGIGALILKSNASQFTGTLAILALSRVPLTDALTAAAQTVSNRVMRAAVQAAAQQVEEGAALSKALRDTALFPPLLVAMIASGEQSGALGPSLGRAAEDQAKDLDGLVAAIVALVEPGVLLVMGGVVMVLVMAILLPIVSLNGLTG